MTRHPPTRQGLRKCIPCWPLWRPDARTHFALTPHWSSACVVDHGSCVASSTKGDVVIVKYIADIANSAHHNYDTDGASFAATSNIVKAKELADGQGFAVVSAPNGTSEDVLKLTGATNGGCGVGSQL